VRVGYVQAFFNGTPAWSVVSWDTPIVKTLYRDLLAEQVGKAGVEVWGYCLMPNHVHLILRPEQADGLGRAVGEAHRRYTNFINARGRWTGHLFQSRFASVAMDQSHLL
jgi:putative transposase